MTYFVLLAGELSLRSRRRRPTICYSTTERGQFSGELALLVDGATTMTGPARVDSIALCISRDSLRELVTRERDIGLLTVRAFIYRRMAFENGGADRPPADAPDADDSKQGWSRGRHHSFARRLALLESYRQSLFQIGDDIVDVL